MAVCVDASVALLWLLPDTLSAMAHRLQQQCIERDLPLIAPPIFRPELTSTIRRWLFSHIVTEPFAREALRRSLRLPVYITDAGDALQLRAFDLAILLDRPRAYDTQYLALAEFNRCELWTADERFANAARHRFRRVRWLGDYQP